MYKYIREKIHIYITLTDITCREQLVTGWIDNQYVWPHLGTTIKYEVEFYTVVHDLHFQGPLFHLQNIVRNAHAVLVVPGFTRICAHQPLGSKRQHTFL